MVLVPGADSLGGSIGIAPVEGPHDTYFIDRHEVTNRQIKQFVDQGGYQKREYWKTPFVKAGKPISWEDAIAEFRDATGRPGPSTWEGGTFPTGKDDFPVTGVSWYEAAAYAAFTGKSLPTLSHWYLAADIRITPLLIPASNFAGKGLASVGSYSSIGPFGTYDMAGNAQEWAWNEADGAFRFILGGAWSSPTYQFNQPDAKPPFDRGAANGFRCARYPTPPRESLLAPVRRTFRDYSLEKPVGDEAFGVIRGAYAYAPRELKATVDEVDDSSPYWRKERVSFSAAYGHERLTAFLFLPKNAKPPYQALVYHPSAGAQSSTFGSMEGFNRMEFIIRSGRAVIYPIYIGTFNRRLAPAASGIELKDRDLKRFQDLRQSIEFLMSRDDINASKLGYLGASWGAASAPMMIALEERFRAAVLFEGGLYLRPAARPEVDNFNFLPRVRVPVLMLNGRYDYTFPLDTSQGPFFRWLGTPEKDKRHIVYDAAHDVMVNRTQVVKEVLSWLDQYLGPVAR
jgi:dienelactone hydrolase